MNNQVSKVRTSIGPGKMKHFKIESSSIDKGFCLSLKDKMGIDVTRFIDTMDTGSLIPSLFPATMSTPVQFLQQWMPGVVFALTKARRIDNLTTYKTAGSWEDEEIVQRINEGLGQPAAYSDFSSTPLSSYNPSYETRTIVRFELGLEVGKLEEQRSARAMMDSSEWKRVACANSLEILRNFIGFYGFNGGINRTYGYLNDPNLPAYLSPFPKVGGGTTWAVATFQEIIRDIRFMLSSLQVQSGDNFDPDKTPMILALGTSVYQYLTITTDLNGYTVKRWVEETMPNLTFVSVPELDAAVGGLNVAYLYFVNIDDQSTDDGSVIDQFIPTKYMFIGNEQRMKYFSETYGMATAGIFTKRPVGIVRMSGI